MQPNTQPGDAQGQYLILVAEDNLVNQRFASMLLTKLGYRVDLASNGAEAVKAAQGSHYDLILMDCQMPEMDGFEATAELRRLEQGVKHTPIIALTASAMIGDQARCLAAGMDDYVTKPIDFRYLAEVLCKWTSGKSGHIQ